MRVRLSAIVTSGLVAAAACGGPARTPAIRHHGSAPLDNTSGASSSELPIDHAEALTRWRNLGLTGAGFAQQLEAVPDDPALRRAMALALLRGGGLACEDVVEQYMCGDSYFEYAPLSPTADFDDPCLRRQLALWSLQQLDAADAAAVSDVLVDLVAMRAPETELQPAAFAVLAPDDDVLRLALLRHAEEPLAELEAASLDSSQARLFAARELHLDAAYAALEPGRHHAALVAGLTDTALTAETRDALITQIGEDDSAATEAALIELTGDDDCALAMRAAETLVARDPAHARYLPSRPSSTDAAAHMQALCMLQHDTDEQRRDARVRAWFGADGLSVILEEHNDYYDDADPDPDADANADDSGEEDGEVDPWATTVEQEGWRTVTTERMRPDAVDSATLGAAVTSGFSCTGLACTSGGAVLTFVDAPDGSLHLSDISTTQYNGCGC